MEWCWTKTVKHRETLEKQCAISDQPEFHRAPRPIIPLHARYASCLQHKREYMLLRAGRWSRRSCNSHLVSPQNCRPTAAHSVSGKTSCTDFGVVQWTGCVLDKHAVRIRCSACETRKNEALVHQANPSNSTESLPYCDLQRYWDNASTACELPSHFHK